MYETLQAGGTFDTALITRDREPDAPNYTPRISGIVDLNDQAAPVALNILKANPVNPDYTDRFTYRPAMPETGIGACLTTYMGDGNPLPSFVGDPVLPVLQCLFDLLCPESNRPIRLRKEHRYQFFRTCLCPIGTKNHHTAHDNMFKQLNLNLRMFHFATLPAIKFHHIQEYINFVI